MKKKEVELTKQEEELVYYKARHVASQFEVDEHIKAYRLLDELIRHRLSIWERAQEKFREEEDKMLKNALSLKRNKK